MSVLNNYDIIDIVLQEIINNNSKTICFKFKDFTLLF